MEYPLVKIGLLSDTHMPEHGDELPASLRTAFAGVDLILHAGDIGDLWVLDRLSEFGPVAAVHGNCDEEITRQAVPYQQVLSIAGRRLLLWHSHDPDPVKEIALRAQGWHPRLDRLVDHAQQVGADLGVFGHTHVPMVRHGCVWLINPGAVSSANLFHRQSPPSVAVLSLAAGHDPVVLHVDLEHPGRSFTPAIDWEADPQQALDQYMPLMVEDRLGPVIGELKAQTYQDEKAVKRAILPLSQLCWAGKKPEMTHSDLMELVENSLEIAEADRKKIVAILKKW